MILWDIIIFGCNKNGMVDALSEMQSPPLCETILLVKLTVLREDCGNVSNIPTWRKSAGMLAEKLTCASLKWAVGALLGPQLLACCAPWDTQEQHVGKPSKNWRRRRRRTASGCGWEESTGFREPRNKTQVQSGPKCKTWTKWPSSIDIYWIKSSCRKWTVDTRRWIVQSLLLNNYLILHTCNIKGQIQKH